MKNFPTIVHDYKKIVPEDDIFYDFRMSDDKPADAETVSRHRVRCG